MGFRKVILMLACVAALAGCSADPYKGSIPAPPDRLPEVAEVPAANTNPGATGMVPLGDGTESVAPNYSGYIPRVTGEH
ncbi:MAG TPA: hypothetical protein VK335_14360 [Bryobacteraceae bacterium]|nr:hypothetical protein [Bryobacteraceae bacterium]